MTYREVCGTEREIWFVLSHKKREGRRFLRWAKSLGCVWPNCSEIAWGGGTDFFTLSVSASGTLANVPAMARAAGRFRNVKRVRFADVYRAEKRKMRNGVWKRGKRRAP